MLRCVRKEMIVDMMEHPQARPYNSGSFEGVLVSGAATGGPGGLPATATLGPGIPKTARSCSIFSQMAWAKI